MRSHGFPYNTYIIGGLYQINAAANPTNTIYNAHIRTTTHRTEMLHLVSSIVFNPAAVVIQGLLFSLCIFIMYMLYDMFRPEYIK